MAGKFLRTFLLMILLSFGSHSASAAIHVISDIDDTAKITNVRNPFLMILNGLFSKRAFSGMQEFYSTLSVAREYEFDYVTGAPEILRYRANIFLRDGGFPAGKVHLKPLFTGESLREYKLRVIRDVFSQYPKDQFILIGDDTQADFMVYDEIFRAAPDRVLAIYIRDVANRKLPPSAYSFLSAFDIARTEYLMGRLTVEQAKPVAQAIIAETKNNRILPHFSHCPLGPIPLLDAQMDEWNRVIDDRIQEICRSRSIRVE